MISRKWLGALAGALAGLAVVGSTIAARAAAGSQVAPASVATPDSSNLPRRTIEANPDSPTISLIDDPSPTCYRPAMGMGACYILWDYVQVTASSSQYIISMTVTIDGHIRAYHSGFFQTSMFVPGQMYGPGFRVTCGFPGASGAAEMGNTFSYAIRARETSGLAAANYGSVTCPADAVNVFMPLILKR
jgi:hypothetical protein